MSNMVDPSQPEGNFYDKYSSSNPIVKWMMKNFFGSLKILLEQTGDVKTVLEAGCGEGAVTNFLYNEGKGKFDIKAFDISEKLVKDAAKQFPEIDFSVQNIYEMNEVEKYDLVVCSEVLEHLEEPEKVIKLLLDASKKYVIVSVPREPIWCVLNMCRGKYLKDFGNTPGHIKHWSKGQFLKFLDENGAEIVSKAYPLPWQMMLIKKANK